MEFVNIVNKLMEAKQIAEIYHLQTEHYSIHKNLEQFYNEIGEHTDTLAEVYMGKMGKLEGLDIMSEGGYKDDPVDYFKSVAKYIEDNRNIVVESFLQSIIDNILVVLYRLIYRITLLK